MSVEFVVEFEELNQDFEPDFHEINNISDGGYERGYEAGYKQGAADNKDFLPDLIGDTLVEYESDKVLKVRKYGFAEATAMKRISLPNCTYLDTSAFQLNPSAEIFLPKVEHVGSNAFSWCKLAKIEMPVKTILTRGFYYCSNLKTLIISQDETVCSLADTLALKGTSIEKGTGYVYVPDNLVDQYKSDAIWSTFAAQIKPKSELSE